MRHPQKTFAATLVIVIAVCSYMLNQTSALALAQDINNQDKKNILNVDNLVDNLDGNYPTLYPTDYNQECIEMLTRLIKQHEQSEDNSTKLHNLLSNQKKKFENVQMENEKIQVEYRQGVITPYCCREGCVPFRWVQIGVSRNF